MPWGKYRGMTLGEIARTDPGYLDWLGGLDNLKPSMRAAVDVVLAALAGSREGRP